MDRSLKGCLITKAWIPEDLSEKNKERNRKTFKEWKEEKEKKWIKLRKLKKKIMIQQTIMEADSQAYSIMKIF